MGEDESAALKVAFDAVLSTVLPARRELVLRRALVQLLADAEPGPNRALVPRSPAITTVDIEAWAVTKARVRAEIELQKMSLSRLAEATAIPLSTIQHVLSPKGTIPGRLIAEKLQAWLVSRENGENDQAEENDLLDDPSVKPGNGAHPPSGNGASPTDTGVAGRLSIEQRERLAACVSLMDRREMRDVIGLSEDAIGRAISGECLDAAILARLVHFLDEATPD